MTPPSFRRWTGIAIIGVAVGMVIVWQNHQQTGDGAATKAAAPVLQASPAAVVLPSQPPAVPGAHSGRPWEDIANWDRLTPHEKLVTLLSRPFGLMTRGRVEKLELAKDELFVAKGDVGLKKVPGIADAEGLLRCADEWKAANGEQPQLVFYPQGAERTDSNRRVLNGRLLLHTNAAQEAMQAATAAGCAKVREIAGLPGYVVAEDARQPGSSLLAAAALSGKAGIAYALPMLGVRLVKMAIPDDPTQDPLFASQWHLKNPRQIFGGGRIDANLFPVNAAPVWGETQGRGVVIGVVDDGLEITHPDLSPHYMEKFSRDFLDSSAPTPEHKAESDGHGTAVAGLAAAIGGNGIGGAGVAPQASIAGLRLVSGYAYTSEEMVMEAISYANDGISIKNNSWGQDLPPSSLGYLSDGEKDALQTAALNGRGGKGVIMTFSSGNSYISDGIQGYVQGNKAGFPNSIYVIAVGAVCASGTRSGYSETGSHLLTCAPSNGGPNDYANPWMVTTDRSGFRGYNPDPFFAYSADLPATDYTNHFSGTSASTAVVSGVIALMLEAQPNLGWRDVKEILLRSGTKVDAKDGDWVSRSGGNPSLPPIKHNHQYGGGMVNAAGAVALAKQWINLGEMQELSRTFSGLLPIPDNNNTGITITHAFGSDTPLRVEQVEVEVTLHHPYRGDVNIDLISPAGTVSHLAYTSNLDSGLDNDVFNSEDRGYRGWVFTSARHWGESSTGNWKVVFKDLAYEDQGTLEGVTIRLHGVAAPPVSIVASPQDVIVPIGTVPVDSPPILKAQAAGLPDFSYQWLKGTAKISGATSASWSISKMSTSSAGLYSVQVTNLTGSVTSAAARVGAVDTSARTLIVNEGTTLTLQATAAGPDIKYQWLKNGEPMTNDKRIAGASAAKLLVTAVTAEDVDSYACRVTVGNATAVTGRFDVQVRVKPKIDPDFHFEPASVSDNFVLQVPAVLTSGGVMGGATAYRITGLPSGLTYNSAGLITGRPNVGGTFTIQITASNAAGSATVTKVLTIEKLAPTTLGTFNGLVAPHSLANGNFGGAVSLVVAPTGSFSGRLILGAASYVLSGRLSASVDTDPSAAVTIKRAGKAAPLKVAFAISRADGHLTGTVGDSLSFTTGLDAWRNPYSSANRARSIATAYNACIDPPADPAAPQGTSYAVLRVNSLGTATWQGWMADRTVATRTTTIGTNGEIPLHIMLYAGTGSAHGWVQVATQPSPALNILTGTLQWVKNAQPASSRTRSYKSGFSGTNLAVTGGQYVLPAAGTVLWGMTGASDTKLTFASGGIESAAAYPDLEDRIMHVQLSHKVQSSSPKPTTLTMHVYTSTGIFTGTAILKDPTSTAAQVSRTMQFFGVVYPDLGKGKGYFILPELPNNSTSPLLSGAMEWISLSAVK